MQMFRDQNKIREFLNDLLTKRESEDLEFKHASGGFPGSFWDTYSSFAKQTVGFFRTIVWMKKISKCAGGVHPRES